MFSSIKLFLTGRRSDVLLQQFVCGDVTEDIVEKCAKGDILALQKSIARRYSELYVARQEATNKETWFNPAGAHVGNARGVGPDEGQCMFGPYVCFYA
jgi:hypothetical protein